MNEVRIEARMTNRTQSTQPSQPFFSDQVHVSVSHLASQNTPMSNVWKISTRYSICLDIKLIRDQNYTNNQITLKISHFTCLDIRFVLLHINNIQQYV